MNQLWPGRPWPHRRLPGRHWPGRRLPGRPWLGRQLWPGRNLWPSRPLWPIRQLWPIRYLPGRPSPGPVIGAGPSTWSCQAGEEISVIVLFSGGLTILGDNCTSRLATYEGLVLSELSRLLSWWLGGDLRLEDARDCHLLGRDGCFCYSGCWLGHWQAEQTDDIR